MEAPTPDDKRRLTIHVVDSISDEASGPSYSVPRLCGALAEQGDVVRLLTLGNRKCLSFSGFQHDAYPPDFGNVPLIGQLRFSKALKTALARSSEGSTIIHMHGLWRMSNVYPAWVAERSKSNIILSPRGMLGGPALKFSAYKKRLFWMAAQGSAARAAKCLHATSQQEYEDIRAFGLKAPVAILPNGIDVPEASQKCRPSDRHRTLLYLGRLHPKKGVEQLLAAWDRINVHHPDWQLDIVGPIDNDYARTLKSQASVDAKSRVRFIGPLFGEDKVEAYRRADLFVLPSLNENFAMTVAEALAQATPVISTKGTPWPELVSHGCGWWIDHGVESLAAAIDEGMRMNWEQLASMGEAGRTWMRRDFDWNGIALSMRSVYAWLRGQCERPPFVVMK